MAGAAGPVGETTGWLRGEAESGWEPDENGLGEAMVPSTDRDEIRVADRASCRSGTRGLPSTSFGPGSGSNGPKSDHSSSDTIHGRD